MPSHQLMSSSHHYRHTHLYSNVFSFATRSISMVSFQIYPLHSHIFLLLFLNSLWEYFTKPSYNRGIIVIWGLPR